MAICQLVSVEVHDIKLPWNVRQAAQTDLAHAFRCVVPGDVSAHYSATLITACSPPHRRWRRLGPTLRCRCTSFGQVHRPTGSVPSNFISVTHARSAAK